MASWSGRLACVLVRRRNSSLIRLSAFMVLTDQGAGHSDFGLYAAKQVHSLTRLAQPPLTVVVTAACHPAPPS